MEPGVSNSVSSGLRVGNGAGFWGDNLDAPYLLARDGRIDVLTLEYLAELTMAILSHLRSKDPAAGYVTDFPDLVERLARPRRTTRAADRDECRGPQSAGVRRALRRTLTGDELDHSLIGVVTGDDVLDRIPGWIEEGSTFRTWRPANPSSASRGVWSRPMCTSVPT